MGSNRKRALLWCLGGLAATIPALVLAVYKVATDAPMDRSAIWCVAGMLVGLICAGAAAREMSQ